MGTEIDIVYFFIGRFGSSNPEKGNVRQRVSEKSHSTVPEPLSDYLQLAIALWGRRYANRATDDDDAGDIRAIGPNGDIYKTVPLVQTSILRSIGNVLAVTACGTRARLADLGR